MMHLHIFHLSPLISSYHALAVSCMNSNRKTRVLFKIRTNVYLVFEEFICLWLREEVDRDFYMKEKQKVIGRRKQKRDVLITVHRCD